MARFQYLLKLALFLISYFSDSWVITSFKTIQIGKVGGVSKNSGNLEQNDHMSFQNWLGNVWEKSPIIDSQKSKKNNNKTPNNESVMVIGFQSWPDVLQHPVDMYNKDKE